MENRMDDTKETTNDSECFNKKIPVTLLGWVCVFCCNETESPCCGECRHELGYLVEDSYILLESELTQDHVIIEE